ncbi:rhombosortase [Aeromonas sp. R6-2]|uniref:rhombosortase n=1 Tax=unclassified Aeromonas TaxID=257493 RepID=UPI0034A5A4F5
MFTKISGWPAAAGLSLLLLLLWLSVPSDALSFQREAIAHGQWWRIITGNLVHTNGWHLSLNLVGLWLLAQIFHDELNSRCLLTVLGLCALGVTLGIWLWCPQTQWYMGLSGALHGLFAWGVVQELGRRRSAGLLLIGLLLKLYIDWQGGDSGGPSAALIGARVHVESHLIGAMAGLLLGLLSRARR